MSKIASSTLVWPNSQVFGNKNTTIKVQRPEGFTLDRAHTLSSPSRVTAQVRTRSTSIPLSTIKTVATVLLLASSVGLSVAYLFSVNSYASSGYEIKKLQNKIQVSTDESTTLQRKVSENSSVLALDQKFSTMGFVPVVGAEFVSVENKQITQR